MLENDQVGLSAPESTPQPIPTGGSLVPVPQRPQLPVRPSPRRRRLLLVLAALLLLVAGGLYWWLSAGPALPPGIASGNGRLEADEIDIDTKFAGRIAQLLSDEGDLVKAGQVVAVMDTQDLQASLKRAEAVVRQSQQALDEAHANVVQQQSQVQLAKLELERAQYLLRKQDISKEVFDQRQQQMDGASAALAAAIARVGEAGHALDAAKHDVELDQVNIADNTLVSPRAGPIEYRVSNVGEVLPAGGKVFTILDASYLYMDIYLPTAEAGRVRIGSDARIVLDAYPGHVIPAKVVFVASQAQFTPKTVETKDERDKLMFRIRLRIDPERLQGREAIVRSGLPGMGYVRTDPSAIWPARLAASAPPSVAIAVPP